MLFKKCQLQAINTPLNSQDRFLAMVNRFMVKAASENRTECVVYVPEREQQHIASLDVCLRAFGYSYTHIDANRILIKW